MKHYLSYDKDGKLVGVHTIHHAGTKLGGWPDECRLEDPSCTDEAARAMRANLLGKANGATAFIAFNCGCSATRTSCRCAGRKLQNSRVANGALVDKREGALLVDGNPVANDAVLSRPPGTVLRLRVACVGALENSAVKVIQRSHVAIMDQQSVDLSFVSGQTAEFVLVAPAQGLTGMIGVAGDDVRPIGLSLRGWASV